MRLTGYPAEAYYNRGIAHGAKGELDKAIEDFTEAIHHQPDYAEVYLGRGTVYAIERKI